MQTELPAVRSAARAEDRMLEHSVIFALIQLDDVAATAEGLGSEDASTRAAAAIPSFLDDPVGDRRCSELAQAVEE